VASFVLLLVALTMLLSALGAALKHEDPDAPPPKWLSVVDRISPANAFGIGTAMILLSVKFWVFTVGAVSAIANAKSAYQRFRREPRGPMMNMTDGVQMNIAAGDRAIQRFGVSAGATASPSTPLRVTESARNPLARSSSSAAFTRSNRSARPSCTAMACGTP